MSQRKETRLYDLLPAIYRIRDAERGEPLRALLAVIEQEFSALEADVERLYDNWFIETCEDWLVPYIGDLLGARRLETQAGEDFSARAWVANTLRYRRRKGTAAVVEQIAFDLTRWRARAVEFFERLAGTQHVNHVRLRSPASVDLRSANRLELVGGPFESATHTVDVRRIARLRGRYNIRNLGLFLWRLQSYPVDGSVARPAADPPDGRFRFDPLGGDIPLFNRPRTEDEITHLAEEVNVPAKLRRRALYEELEARRRGPAGHSGPKPVFFGSSPVLRVHVDGEEDPIPPEQIAICDLGDPKTPIPSGWRRPPAERDYEGESMQIRVGVDPQRGRLAFPEGASPAKVRVSYAYGFSADLGGGPYDRSRSLRDVLPAEVDFQIEVTKRKIPVPGETVPTLREAIELWNQATEEEAGKHGLVVISDSESYEESLTGDCAITIRSGCSLRVVAAGWPEKNGVVRSVAGLVPLDVRPHLIGDVAVRGSAPETVPGELLLNGLWIEGRLDVLGGDLGALDVVHCTLVPGKGGIRDAAATSGEESDRRSRLALRLVRSICGPIHLAGSNGRVELRESIVDGLVGSTDGVELNASSVSGAAQPPAVKAPGVEVDALCSTLFGGLEVFAVEASNSIFTGQVHAERRQKGCVRFSFVPYGSRTPRRFRTQPELALQQRAVELCLEFETLPASERDSIRARIFPQFTSSRHGDPAYGQLSGRCAEEIRTGADDGAEMGVFGILKQPQREANLRAGIEGHLRVGLEAGFFHTT